MCILCIQSDLNELNELQRMEGCEETRKDELERRSIRLFLDVCERKAEEVEEEGVVVSFGRLNNCYQCDNRAKGWR